MSFSLLGKIASDHIRTLQKEAAPRARRPVTNDVPFESDGGILDDPGYKAHTRQMQQPQRPMTTQQPMRQPPVRQPAMNMPRPPLNPKGR